VKDSGMNVRPATLLISLLSISMSYGQNELWVRWNDTTLHDTVRLQAMAAVMRSVRQDKDTLLALANMQETFARKPGLETWRIRALQRQGEALAHNGRIAEAIARYDTVIVIQERSANYKGISDGLGAIGSLLYKAGHYDQAMEKFLEAMHIREELKDKVGVAGIMTSMGLLHMDHGDAEGALALYQKSKAIYTSEEDSVRLAILLNTMGTPLRALGRCAEAIPDHIQSMAIHQRFGRQIGIAASLNHLAAAYNCLSKPHEALEYSTQSLRIRESIGDTAGVGYARIQQAKAYLLLNDFAAVVRCGKEALRIGTKMVQIPIRKEACELLYQGYKGLNEWQRSLEMRDQWIRINDSLSGDETKRAIMHREYEYAYAQQALADSLEMVRLANEERCEFDGRMQRENERREFLVAFGVVTLIVFLLIAYFLMQRLKQARISAAREKQLHGAQVDQLLGQQEIKSINAMLEGQETERDRMAKDLHDRLGSMLGGIKANMAALEDRVEQVQKDQQFGKVNRLLDQAVGELRQISHDMAAATLSRFGLEKALKDLRDTIHINGRLSVELNVFGLDHRLERSVELAVYRMVQELVSNVLKHAEARELSIAVTRTPGRLSVVVSDDGKGFDTSVPAEGMGLSNVRSRAAALGATVQVDSTPGKGTTVSVESPVVE